MVSNWKKNLSEKDFVSSFRSIESFIRSIVYQSGKSSSFLIPEDEFVPECCILAEIDSVYCKESGLYSYALQKTKWGPIGIPWSSMANAATACNNLSFDDGVMYWVSFVDTIRNHPDLLVGLKVAYDVECKTVVIERE